MSEIWFARHGQSVWNAERRWQGQADPPLSELGWDQARELAESLRGHEVGMLASSDQRRALDTARVVGEMLGLEPRVEPRLREHHVGAWSGLRKEEVAARFPGEFERFLADDLTLACGGGETRHALRERVVAGLAPLFEAAHPGPLLVISHMGVLRSLKSRARLGNAEWVRLPASVLEARIEVAEEYDGRESPPTEIEL